MKNRSIYQVDPWLVDLQDTIPHRRDVRYQLDRLNKEGQIEPVEVRMHATENLFPGRYTLDPDGWTYANAQVQAARELEWKTILVTY